MRVYEDIYSKARSMFGDEKAKQYTVKALCKLSSNISLNPQEAKIGKSYLQSLMSHQSVYTGSCLIDFDKDLEGLTISDRLVRPELVERYGTLEHSDNTYVNGEEPIVITNVKVYENKLNVKFRVNNDSPEYEQTIQDIEEGKLTHISPEFINGIKYNNHIFEVESIKMSLTGNPKQPNNVISFDE